jgi:hypothetical protein
MIYLCLMPLFLEARIAFLIDSNENINDRNLELPQMSILCSASEKVSNTAFIA